MPKDDQGVSCTLGVDVQVIQVRHIPRHWFCRSKEKGRKGVGYGLSISTGGWRIVLEISLWTPGQWTQVQIPALSWKLNDFGGKLTSRSLSFLICEMWLVKLALSLGQVIHKLRSLRQNTYYFSVVVIFIKDAFLFLGLLSKLFHGNAYKTSHFYTSAFTGNYLRASRKFSKKITGLSNSVGSLSSGIFKYTLHYRV